MVIILFKNRLWRTLAGFGVLLALVWTGRATVLKGYPSLKVSVPGVAEVANHGRRENVSLVSTSAIPEAFGNLRGTIVFQRQTPPIDGVEQEDAELWVYDLGGVSGPVCLNQVWKATLGANFPLNLHHTINAHFSPDGKMLTFAGIWNDDPPEWDVFRCRIDGSSLTRLTGPNGLRDEDPKFSPDGSQIVYKHNRKDINLMAVDGRMVRTLDIAPAVAERSMPYFTADGKTVLFADGKGAEMNIYRCAIAGGRAEPVANEEGIQEYYPIAWTGGRILYSRWTGKTENERHDQIYAIENGQSSTFRAPLNLPESDSSDAFPINARLILFSSLRTGTGGYDLFVGDTVTGEVSKLQALRPDVVLNTAKHEFGVAYSTFSSQVEVKVTRPAHGAVFAASSKRTDGL